MQQTMSGASPSEFMQNYEGNFNQSEDIFEMVRRLSEQEADRNRQKNKSNPEVVAKLPIIKIEDKHCKAK